MYLLFIPVSLLSMIIFAAIRAFSRWYNKQKQIELLYLSKKYKREKLEFSNAVLEALRYKDCKEWHEYWAEKWQSEMEQIDKQLKDLLE